MDGSTLALYRYVHFIHKFAAFEIINLRYNCIFDLKISQIADTYGYRQSEAEPLSAGDENSDDVCSVGKCR